MEVRFFVSQDFLNAYLKKSISLYFGRGQYSSSTKLSSLSTLWKEGKLLITELDKNYGAYQSGLNVFDEIIAIDGFRITKDFAKIYEHKKINDYIDVIISRQGIIKSYKVTLTANKQRNITFALASNVSAKQQALLNKWLHVHEQ